MLLLEKCKKVLTFVSYAEICSTLIKQMIPKTHHNNKTLRQKCKELVTYLWNTHHFDGYLSMLIWDCVSRDREEHSSGKLNLIEQKLKQLCVDLKEDVIRKEI